MPYVLTKSSKITCGHGGTVEISAQSKLSVATQGVLIKSDVDRKSVSLTCTNLVDEQKHLKKCSSCAVSGGEAGKLTVHKSPVLLDSLSGTTDGNPLGSLKLEVGTTQTKLSAS